MATKAKKAVPKYQFEERIAINLHKWGYRDIRPQMEFEQEDGSVIYWDVLGNGEEMEIQTETKGQGEWVTISELMPESELYIHLVTEKLE